jgi:cellulose synthase/poly-beta-1,6-N-acetylglucosamine synthase-like glycosyltransferase
LLAALILALSAGATLYILAGYPLLLCLSKRRAAPVRKDFSFRPTVTVLVAVYNGEEFIQQKLNILFGLDYPAELLDVVVVSDGSTDRTDEVVRANADRRVQLVRVAHQGKASALNEGFRHAAGEIVFFTDVRQWFAPDSLTQLVANFADPSVGAVTGEPRFQHSLDVGEEADMDVYWRYELWARRRHSEIDSTLVTTGWIYAVRRSLVSPIPPDSLTDDAFIPLRVLLAGHRVICEPQAVAFDYAQIQGGEFRRKMRTLAGLWQVCFRMPGLFAGTNRMRLHFVSHKFSRLVLPWLMLFALLAALALPSSGLRSGLLIATLVVIILALADPLLPAAFPFRRISSPAKSFIVMNLAALFSVAVFFVSPNRIWRPTRVQPQAPAPLLEEQSENKP